METGDYVPANGVAGASFAFFFISFHFDAF